MRAMHEMPEASDILHLIPRGVFANTHQGSYKDTISRVRYLEKNGSRYHSILLDDDRPEALSQAAQPMESPPRILVEYSLYPKTVRYLRKRHPHSFIAVRAHNIEPLQHLDNHGWRPRKGRFWFLYGFARLLAGDIHCKRAATAIYSISEYENRVYWNRLPGAARVEWLPYYCPEHLVPDKPAANDARSIIACLPTSQKNRKSVDLVNRFVDLAETSRRLGLKHRFIITGDLSSWRLGASEAVQLSGLIENLPDFLSTVAAVCLLSPLGHGFKTTMADAIAAHAYVLAHPQIARRCPALLQPAIIPLDTEQADQISGIWPQLQRPFPITGANAKLREIGQRILAGDF